MRIWHLVSRSATIVAAGIHVSDHKTLTEESAQHLQHINLREAQTLFLEHVRFASAPPSYTKHKECYHACVLCLSEVFLVHYWLKEFGHLIYQHSPAECGW